jgi:hypothetical protein
VTSRKTADDCMILTNDRAPCDPAPTQSSRLAVAAHIGAGPVYSRRIASDDDDDDNLRRPTIYTAIYVIYMKCSLIEWNWFMTWVESRRIISML